MNLNYALAAVAALSLSFGLAAHQGLRAPALMAVIDQIYPIRATEFVRDSRLPGPMYNSYNWGGFLTLTYVSIQSRSIPAWMLMETSWRRALSIPSTPSAGRTIPILPAPTFVLLERSVPLASALEGDPRYRLAYKDHLAAVFIREQGRQ